MAQPASARVPKTSRALLSSLIWGGVLLSFGTLAWRFISGDTLENQHAAEQEAKAREAISQSAKSSPSSIAGLYEQQRTDAEKRRAKPAGDPELKLPPGRPETPAQSAPAPSGTGEPQGEPLPTPEKTREAAWGSPIKLYGSDTPRSAVPPASATASPVGALMDQIKTLQQGAGERRDQSMTEYVKGLQAQAAKVSGGGGFPGMPAAQSAAGASGPSSYSTHADLEWLSAQKTPGSTADDEPLRPTAVTGEWFLMEGTPIRIALAQDLNSDLPGEFSAMVTRDVYDSLGKGHKLIPWGTLLRGRYNSEVSPGQTRILFAFTSMRFPQSGARVRLKGMPGSDLGGASGAEADVDRHFWKIFGSGLLVGTAALIAGRAASNSNSSVTVNVGGSNYNSGASVASQALSDTVRGMLNRNQNIKDTLTLHKGDVFTVITNRDMELPPSLTGVTQY